MPIYKIKISAIFTENYNIKADSEKEAEDIARIRLQNGLRKGYISVKNDADISVHETNKV